MTSVSEIIRDAYRESNLIAIGAALSADQLSEGLTLLSRFKASVLGNEAGEELRPLAIGQNGITYPSGFPTTLPAWFIPVNVRLYLNLNTAQSVYLHPVPRDGARFALLDESGNLASHNLTVYGNGRKIDGSVSKVFSTNSDSREYFYRADLGEWLPVDPLTASDDWPFPEEFDDMFVIGLSIRLNPRHETDINSATVEAYRRLTKQFKARYRQKKNTHSELGLIRLNGARRRLNEEGSLFGDSGFSTGNAFEDLYR